ncbi:MAG: hypothetical protein ACRDD1_16575, partial [Planctomycetia bacterium]
AAFAAADPVPAPPARPAGPELPALRSLTVYRNGSAWVERAGQVAWSKEGAEIALDQGAVPSTVAVATKADGASIGQTLFPPSAEFGGHAGLVAVRVAPKPGAPVAAGLIEVTTGAWVRGPRWTPTYTIERLAEGRMRLSLIGVISFAGLGGARADATSTERFDKVVLSLALPDDLESSTPVKPLPIDRTTPVQGAFDVGPLTVRRHWLARTTILEREAAVEELVEWNVGATTTPNAATPAIAAPIEQGVRLWRWKNDGAAALPAGQVVRTVDGVPQETAGFDGVEAGEAATLRLGPAVGLRLERTELEVERKQPAIRRENGHYDYAEIAGSLTIDNRRPAPVALEIAKVFEGEGLAASDDGRIRRRPNQIGRTRPLTEIRWTITVAPGATRRLTYAYQIDLPGPDEE